MNLRRAEGFSNLWPDIHLWQVFHCAFALGVPNHQRPFSSLWTSEPGMFHDLLPSGIRKPLAL